MISILRRYLGKEKVSDVLTQSDHRTGFAETTLKTRELQIERKTFVFTLKENSRGRFLRITEICGERRNSVIVPERGLQEFETVLAELSRAAIDA